MSNRYKSVAKEGFIALSLSLAFFLLVLFPNLPLGIEQVYRQSVGEDKLAGVMTPGVYEYADAVQRSGETPDWFIGDRIKYASDFEVWGNFDYWETPQEVIDKGRTDCEGTAVLTKAVYSVINQRRCMNLSTSIVSQQHHVYVEVKTPQNRTLDLYKMPEKSGLEKILEGLSEFVNQIPFSRQAVLVAGLFAIWLNYALHIHRLFKKQRPSPL
jgi:hypothetical protein